MKIASWNVNSLRARLDHVEDYLRSAGPDVLCLQETKVVDEDFPLEIFSRLGYEVERIGQRTYNGVAIASKLPLTEVEFGLADPEPDDGARLIGATVGGVRVYSAYVPNGKSLDSPSYPYKLKWLARLRKTLEQQTAPDRPVAVCGDFNIARDDRDVFDPEAMRDKIHFSPREHAALTELLDWGLSDSFRRVEEGDGHYSWWDYRMGAFRRNRGLRIDYIFVTEPLAARTRGAGIDTTPRTWTKPSDHAPTWLQLND